MPQSARLTAGGGSNGYLGMGNAQMNSYIFMVGLPLGLERPRFLFDMEEWKKIRRSVIKARKEKKRKLL